MTAHHAIIPTAVAKPDAKLTAAERGVYELVARRYLAQFHPSFEFHETKIEIRVGDELFRASGRETVVVGWRAVVEEPAEVPAADDRNGADEASLQPLPVLQDGESIRCDDVTIAEKRTTPPKRFTDSTLIEAMTGIARFVDDPKIKRLLRETDGIGTPATQAQIIEMLFDRRFIEKQGRQIRSTAVGRALIQTLPEIATRPDMTALWEAAMRRISEGQMPLGTFLGGVLDQLRQLVASGRAQRALAVPVASPTGASSPVAARPRRSRPSRTGRREDRRGR